MAKTIVSKFRITAKGGKLGRTAISPSAHLRDPNYGIHVIARYLAHRKTPASAEEIYAKLKRTAPLGILGRWGNYPTRGEVRKTLAIGIARGFFKQGY